MSPTRPVGREPAFEMLGDPAAGGPFILTCEHASNRLPEEDGRPPWKLTAKDRSLLEEHWGYDLGAANLTRALQERTGSCAVLSCFSRLVCDPNRDPEEASFVVKEVAGHALSFNRGVNSAERRRRRAHYADPYHAAVGSLLTQRTAAEKPVHLCSVHTFTERYLETPRSMEVGVLFDAHETHAQRLASALTAEGFATSLNAPYSGYAGLIYSARRHGREAQVPYLEIEIRQDLLGSAGALDQVAARIARALEAFSPADGFG